MKTLKIRIPIRPCGPTNNFSYRLNNYLLSAYWQAWVRPKTWLPCRDSKKEFFSVGFFTHFLNKYLKQKHKSMGTNANSIVMYQTLRTLNYNDKLREYYYYHPSTNVRLDNYHKLSMLARALSISEFFLSEVFFTFIFLLLWKQETRLLYLDVKSGLDLIWKGSSHICILFIYLLILFAELYMLTV